jgi:hypothetical protein
MSHLVTPEQARDFTLAQQGVPLYVTEASDLRFEPGRWPAVLTVPATFGNGRPMTLAAPILDEAGECSGMAYRQPGAYGVVLHVFND